MLRTLKLIGVAAATSVVSVVAVPAVTAGAANDLGVYITYSGTFLEQGSILAPTGSSVLLGSNVSSDVPVKYAWNVDAKPAVGGAVSSLTGSKIRVECKTTGVIKVKVTVADESGTEAFDVLNVSCEDLPAAEITPAPTVPGERERIAVGTTVTFRSSNRIGLQTENEWRTTGVAGVDGYEDTYTRTFDEPGSFGVELTQMSALGQSKTWVGYTVIGPPTASVTPAPASGPLAVAVGQTVTFDGARSYSPGRGALKYEWRTTGVPDIAAKTASYARKFDRVGDFSVELTVVDEFGQSSKRSLTVSVTRSEPPVAVVTPAPANPKARMTVRAGSLVSFDGRASKDPDGGPLTYQWRTTGERGVVAKTSTYSRRFNHVGWFGVELTVTDNEGKYTKRWVGVNVIP